MTPRDIVLEIVREHPGVSGPRLVADVIFRIYKSLGNYQEYDLMKLLDQMVASGEIVEVEYLTPQMNYRIKSLYFPSDTRIEVKQSCK